MHPAQKRPRKSAWQDIEPAHPIAEQREIHAIQVSSASPASHLPPHLANAYTTATCS
jgi:hypothetical protein